MDSKAEGVRWIEYSFLSHDRLKNKQNVHKRKRPLYEMC